MAPNIPGIKEYSRYRHINVTEHILLSMDFILARARVIFLYLFIKLRIKFFTFSVDFGESCSSERYLPA